MDSLVRAEDFCSSQTVQILLLLCKESIVMIFERFSVNPTDKCNFLQALAAQIANVLSNHRPGANGYFAQ